MKYGFLIASVFSLVLAGCDEVPSSDAKMNRQQEQLSAEAASQVGMPSIVNFQEKRMMKQIIELRDRAISTQTYVIDLNGRLHKLCDSVGYGLPYSTQYTNPQKDIYYGTSSASHMAMPQADPNGLFSPSSADGTWVLCRDPEKDKAKNRGVMPIYVEPHVVVSPFPLPSVE